jgi:chromosome segregation ATPase
MRNKSLLHQLTLGLLAGILVMPPSIAQAQWTVFDPSQYALQVAKKVEEANRWIQHYTNLAQQLTTLGGVLKAADDLVAKQKNAITTMSNIGRTVRASYQLKDQIEAIVTTRLETIKRIDERLKNGIFDPEQDMRDFDEYLQQSVGRSSQDTIATRERLARMDNQLERWQLELKRAETGFLGAQKDKTEAKSQLKEEEGKPEDQRCVPCIANLIQKISNCDLLIAQYGQEIADLRCQIENRVKQYNIQMQERIRFGEQVQSMNEAWGRFNNSLDELQRALSKVN